MKTYEYFSVVTKGSLLGGEPSEIDVEATHEHRDAALLSRVSMLAEILRAGMLDSGRVADELAKLVVEAKLIAKDVGF